MLDTLWVRLFEAQALIAGLEAENRTLRLQCRRYLREWTEARRERDQREKEADRG